MGHTGWAVVTATGLLVVGAINARIVRGIRSGSLRRNHFVGIRTVATLRDDESWRIAHQASLPALRWAVTLSVLTAIVVIAARDPYVSAFALLVPITPMVVGGLQGQGAARRHQRE